MTLLRCTNCITSWPRAGAPGFHSQALLHLSNPPSPSLLQPYGTVMVSPMHRGGLWTLPLACVIPAALNTLVPHSLSKEPPVLLRLGSQRTHKGEAAASPDHHSPPHRMSPLL
ncbi:unnamed protein product, partial [Gulo gulo]